MKTQTVFVIAAGLLVVGLVSAFAMVDEDGTYQSSWSFLQYFGESRHTPDDVPASSR